MFTLKHTQYTCCIDKFENPILPCAFVSVHKILYSWGTYINFSLVLAFTNATTADIKPFYTTNGAFKILKRRREKKSIYRNIS